MRRFFFQNFKKLSTYVCVQLVPCVDRIPPTTQGCIRIMVATCACVQVVPYDDRIPPTIHPGQFFLKKGANRKYLT